MYRLDFKDSLRFHLEQTTEVVYWSAMIRIFKAVCVCVCVIWNHTAS